MMSVQWDKHETELLSHLFRYFSGEAFVDVTLWCSGCHFKAHRVMLSACSAYLEVSRRPALEKTPTLVLSQPRVLLEHHSCGGEPVAVMLHGIEPENMCRLLELMYRGRTQVSASELPRLLETAAALGVRLLESSTLRVCAAGADPLAADASTAPPNGNVAQSAPQCDDQLTETKNPPEKDVGTSEFVMMGSAPPCTIVSSSGQSHESPNDAHQADDPATDCHGSSAMLPPVLPQLPRSPRPLPPPLSLPANSLPPTADDPQLSPSVSTTDPPQKPCSMDQSLVSPQTYSSHQSRNPILSPAPQILPLPPPSSLPSSPLPIFAENPQLPSPVFAAVAPKHPYTVDRSIVSSQKHLPGAQFHQLQEQLDAHPRDIGPAPQGPSEPNPACNSSYSTPADAHEPTAQISMAQTTPTSPAQSPLKLRSFMDHGCS
ncbi:uncharacterized protein LOC126282328 [Schistocerca gregaria]|uniref:uncharacterized protein LOC126282328 n=1 Tax=Schistocerca gregaria TaxID=7010 RepID=UPI00211EA945|nr:uncharacterized protein LOC126282328 [Schistocerca gregaria]